MIKVPTEYRDEYSQAKIFVPTQDEVHFQSSLKELEKYKEELKYKLKTLDKVIETHGNKEEGKNGI